MPDCIFFFTFNHFILSNMCCLCLMCFFIFLVVWVTEWLPFGKIAALLAYEMFSKYKYLIVNLLFLHLCF